jgi:vacuolar protein sorting-associated protein 13A/C
VALQASVLSGEVTHVTEVPVGDAIVLWHLPWPEMLSAELAWWYNKADLQQQQQQLRQSQLQLRGAGSAASAAGAAAAAAATTATFNSAAPADGLLLHRKHRSEDGALYYEVHCA